MPIENIKWKELECTGTDCQKRRGQEAGRYGLNNTTKIASEMLWNVEPFVRKRGVGGKERNGCCQAERREQQEAHEGQSTGSKRTPKRRASEKKA